MLSGGINKRGQAQLWGCKPETPKIPPGNVRSEVSGHRVNPTRFTAYVLPGLERRLPPIVDHAGKQVFYDTYLESVALAMLPEQV
jgi:hypothetical protein